MLLAACSQSAASLPPASQLLQQAAQAMGQVTSARFLLQVSGDPTGLPVSEAKGVLARGGQAQGSLTFGGSAYDFRITGGTFYINAGPSWVHSPAPFDPSMFLDPDQGLASLLAKATGGQTRASESVGGVGAYKIQMTVPADLVKGLSDLAPGQDSLAATMWIAADGSRLLKFRIPFRHDGASADTLLTGTLTDFNLHVEVRPPA
jgi:lipoprotein LprG